MNLSVFGMRTGNIFRHYKVYRVCLFGEHFIKTQRDTDNRRDLEVRT